MIICYLSSKDKKFFKLQGDVLLPINDFNKMSLFTKIFQKRLLIISKELLFHVKKKFPPLTLQELKQAVASEVEDLVPYRSYAFHYQIHRKTDSFFEVHIWIWDKSYLEKLLDEGFSFSHVIPEDLIFSSERPTLYILPRERFYYIVTTKEGKFFDSSLLSSISEELPLYLHSLSDFKVSEIVIFNEISPQEEESLKKIFSFSSIIVKREKNLFTRLPYFIKALDLKNFKVKPEITLSPAKLIYTTIRFFFYFILVLSFYFYVSQKSYQREIKKLKEEIANIDFQLKAITKKDIGNQTQPDFQITFTEFQEELKQKKSLRTSSLLSLLDQLAYALPDGAQIRTLELRERKLKLNLIANDAVEVVERIRKLSFVSDLKLSSPPFFDKTKNKYTLQIELTLTQND